MKRICLLFLLTYLFLKPAFGQVIEDAGNRILFQGIVMDAEKFSIISGSQITINKDFAAVSNTEGTFAFYVNKHDTVVFFSLGYVPTTMIISDTLAGHEFVAGIYMKSDTMSIGEVVIVPRYSNLKSELLNGKSKTPSTMDNARYNVAVSAYQGRNSISSMNDPSSNYAAIREKQKVAAYEKGGIRPSDQMIGLNVLAIIPAAYLLIKGKPEKPGSYNPEISPYELEQIQKKYLETVNQRK
jgi:hypothetical protein